VSTVTLCRVDIGAGQTIERPFDDTGDLFGRIARWVRKLGVTAMRGSIIDRGQTIGDAIAFDLDALLRRDRNASEPEMLACAAWAVEEWHVMEGQPKPRDWREVCETYVQSVLDARREDRHMAETLADAGRAGRRGGW